MKKVFLFLLVVANGAMAQVKLYIPRDVQSLYEYGTRSADGRPGKNYWQNSADYTIAINYNPVTRLLTGTEEITYFNNSPDVLKEIVFKLYPNFYMAESMRDYAVDKVDLNAGVDIAKLSIDGTLKKNIVIDGTNMTVRSVHIAPGKSAKISIQFSYTLNKTSHLRTGEIENNAAFIAYFFPRIAVYDDLDGWNKNPYLGSAEMYNDFCNFNVAITVPKDFLVWATGDLQNCSEVLNTKYCERLSNAEKKDDVVFIVDENDLKAGNITKADSLNTWKFNAKNVVDFAFALSDHYVWNSTSLVVDKTTGRRTRVDALFNTKHKDYFEVIHDGRKTVELMSFNFPKWPFPYSHISVFDGLDQMEYPMMANDNAIADDRMRSATLTEHEIFHTMFPFYMGVNETKYGWMDEGWATASEWLHASVIDSTLVDDYGIDRTERYSGTEVDMPIVTLTTMQKGMPFFLNSYPKPAYGYLFVKDMLGDELFIKALHFYIQQWNGKHPLPLDFFNCMNTGSGKNLNWFWKKWFYDDGYPDLAIASVSNITINKKIIIESKGNKPVPVDAAITFADGSTQKIHRSIAVWEKGNNKVTLSFTSAKKITKVELGSLYVPDTNKEDNVWQAKQL